MCSPCFYYDVDQAVVGTMQASHSAQEEPESNSAQGGCTQQLGASTPGGAESDTTVRTADLDTLLDGLGIGTGECTPTSRVPWVESGEDRTCSPRPVASHSAPGAGEPDAKPAAGDANQARSVGRAASPDLQSRAALHLVTPDASIRGTWAGQEVIDLASSAERDGTEPSVPASSPQTASPSDEQEWVISAPHTAARSRYVARRKGDRGDLTVRLTVRGARRRACGFHDHRRPSMGLMGRHVPVSQVSAAPSVVPLPLRSSDCLCPPLFRVCQIRHWQRRQQRQREWGQLATRRQ